MTSIPAPQAAISPAPPPRTVAAPAAGPAQTASIDPFKLLNRYKWILAIAAGAGAVVGTVSHYVLRSVRPVWTPTALFQALPPTQDITEISSGGNTDEMLRFMQTQLRIMTSEQVMQRVVEDPSLLNNCPGWSKEFTIVSPDTGAPMIDTAEALKDLRKSVKARVISGTALIELSASGSFKWDTTEIVRLIKEKYLAVLSEQGRSGLDDKIAQARGLIDRLDKDAQSLASKKQTLIAQRNVDAIDTRAAANRMEYNDVSGKLILLQQSLESGRTQLKQMESEWNNPGGIVYGDELRERAERDPQILNLKNEITSLQTSQQSLLGRGIAREHRYYQQLSSQLEASVSALEDKRSEVLKKLFAADLDSVRKTLAALEANEAQLLNQKKALQERMTDLSRAEAEMNDLDTATKGLIDNRSKVNAELQNLIAQAQSRSVNRVVLLQAERPPSEMSFPQLKLLLPAGTAIFLGLAAGIVLLREIVDQRVKSPSDVLIIPRTRLIGWVPDAAEDPAGAGAVETAFRDRPRGIMAESFRQIRASINKRFQQSGHATLVVMSGMPAAGATSVAANLALAFAAADKRVLLIDANFRRPAMHRVFALQEAPGLADVLAKSRTLAECAQATTTPNLDLLCAGSKEHRVFERLSTDAVSEMLAQARSAYDLVLIDVAPVVVGNDAFALASRCDASLLVVRAMADKRGMVARIKNELSDHRSELLGVVVNGVKSAAGGYMKRNIQTAHEYQSA